MTSADEWAERATEAAERTWAAAMLASKTKTQQTIELAKMWALVTEACYDAGAVMADMQMLEAATNPLVAVHPSLGNVTPVNFRGPHHVSVIIDEMNDGWATHDPDDGA